MLGHLAAPLWDVLNGQGPRQLAELVPALLLSSLIGDGPPTPAGPVSCHR
ncbi:hypothetical protein ACFY71_13855 [Streptomyces cinerochromogenes]